MRATVQPGHAGTGDSEATPTQRRGRLWEWASAGVIAAVAVYMLAVQIDEIVARWSEVEFGTDYNVVMEAARRWLDGGPFYLPIQLAGPYQWPGPYVLYPPTSLLLFVPFSFLPGFLWWTVPIGVIAWAVWKHRPRPLAWAVILFCIANPTSISMTLWGNPGLYAVAALAIGMHYGWPAVLVLFKPTLAPFALFGSWQRSWWVALGVFALVSLPFVPLWIDYIVVVQHARPPGGPGYSIAQIPAMLLPIAAWLGRSEDRTRPAASIARR